MKKKAIVTLAIGEKYIQMFENICRKNWANYCEKFDYDLIVISKSLDESTRSVKRSPAWQKLLICSQDWSLQYDQLVWVDADILINHAHSPDICAGTPIDRISAVETYSIPDRRIHDISLKRLYDAWDLNGVKYIDNLSPSKYYSNRGINLLEGLDSVVQTGVFVCSPQYHRQFFEHVYNSYEDEHGSEWNYEMPALSYEILKNNLQNWLDPKFNYCVMNIYSAYYPFIFNRDEHLNFFKKGFDRLVRKMGVEDRFIENDKILALKNIYDLGFFIHFAGCSSLMSPLAKSIK
jgi:hypothetical protein